MSRGGNIKGIVHLQNQNYLCKESVDQRLIYGHKNPNDSHNHHDENHDEKNSIYEIVTGAHNDIQH